MFSDIENVSVMGWTHWNTWMKSNDKCLPQKQFPVYCISDQHVCMTQRLWQQPHRYKRYKWLIITRGLLASRCSQLVRYNQMLRSKTACHAAIWHGEIRLDEIRFKMQEMQRLQRSPARYRVQIPSRGGLLRHEHWHSYTIILLFAFGGCKNTNISLIHIKKSPSHAILST